MISARRRRICPPRYAYLLGSIVRSRVGDVPDVFRAKRWMVQEVSQEVKLVLLSGAISSETSDNRPANLGKGTP
jgi:hypothetical protein